MGIEEVDAIEDSEEEEPSQTAMEIALQRAQTQRHDQQSRRQEKHQRHPDLSEREDILARTLKQHSKQQ
jgi:hypothetical protein